MPQTYYGGQAVIEGVMMRGQRQATVAVRGGDGQVITKTELLPPRLYGTSVSRLPLLRGLVALWEMLILGTRMLLFSATVQARGEQQQEVSRRLVLLTMTFSLSFVIGVFFVLPLLVARLGAQTSGSTLEGNAVEGVVRLVLLAGYLALIGRLQKIRRVFQYHGAEHKAVNAYEHGAPLTPASVQSFSTRHVRCGTSFLLWVVVLSIFVFSLIGHPGLAISVASRILLVPVIAAVSYELLRLGARYYHLWPVRMAVQPGLWLQALTTREPTDDQVEIAIQALVPVLHADGAHFESVVPEESIVLEPSRAPA